MPVLIVAGPCDYYNRSVIVDGLVDQIFESCPEKIISGDSEGVCNIVARLCYECDIKYERYYVTEREIIKMGTHLLAFYDGDDKTHNIMRLAKQKKLKVKIIKI